MASPICLRHKVQLAVGEFAEHLLWTYNDKRSSTTLREVIPKQKLTSVG